MFAPVEKKAKTETKIKRFSKANRENSHRVKEGKEIRTSRVFPSPSSLRTKDFFVYAGLHTKEVKLKWSWDRIQWDLIRQRFLFSSSNVPYPGFVNSIMQTQHEAIPILIGRWYLKPTKWRHEIIAGWLIYWVSMDSGVLNGACQGLLFEKTFETYCGCASWA